VGGERAEEEGEERAEEEGGRKSKAAASNIGKRRGGYTYQSCRAEQSRGARISRGSGWRQGRSQLAADGVMDKVDGARVAVKWSGVARADSHGQVASCG
jgi:hypothetical protein